MQVPSMFYALLTIFAGMIFGILAKFSGGRYLLENYPSFFSFGLVSKDGPSKEMAENTNFVMTLVGQGWKEKVTDPKSNHQDEPNRQVEILLLICMCLN